MRIRFFAFVTLCIIGMNKNYAQSTRTKFGVPTYKMIKQKKEKAFRKIDGYEFHGEFIRVGISPNPYKEDELSELSEKFQQEVNSVNVGNKYLALINSDLYLNQPHYTGKYQEQSEEVNTISKKLKEDNLEHMVISLFSKDENKAKKVPIPRNSNNLEEIIEGVETSRKVDYYYRIQILASKDFITEEKENFIINNINDLLIIEYSDENEIYPFSYLMSQTFDTKAEALLVLQENVIKYHKDAFIVEYKVITSITKVIDKIRMPN